MWARRAIAGVLLLTLAVLPVFAGDSETEVVSDVESTSDNSDTGDNSGETDIMVVLMENTETINNNLAFLVACVLGTGGLIVGYWTGKDLLSIW